MKLTRIAKVTRTALCLGVLLLIFAAGSTTAHQAKPQDKMMSLYDCSSGMDLCYFASCVLDGDECSQWNGACFNWPENGYCGE